MVTPFETGQSADRELSPNWRFAIHDIIRKMYRLWERESHALKEGHVRIEQRPEKMERPHTEGHAELLDTIRDLSKREPQPKDDAQR